MPKGCARSCVLSAFSCWLVILSSGDDFNLARAILPPSTPLSEDLLPLDDPNTDFTESSQSLGPANIYRDRGGCTTYADRYLAGAARPSSFAAPADGHAPRPCLNIPLRC
jgi:hypothetical protein